jgi:hypothetical protein
MHNSGVSIGSRGMAFRVLVMGLLGSEDASRSAIVAQAIVASGMEPSFVDPISLVSINTGIVRTDAVVVIMDSANFSFLARRSRLANLEI